MSGPHDVHRKEPHQHDIFLVFRRGVTRPPIMDLNVLFTALEPVPENFTKVTESVGGRPASLNAGSATGRDIYLAYRRSNHPALSRRRPPCIADVIVLNANESHDVPLGYEVVDKTFGGRFAKLNSSRGAHMYLACAFCEASDPRAVTGIALVFVDKKEQAPSGFQLVDTLPTGQPANLAVGAATGRNILLAISRDPRYGAPLADIGVQFKDCKEVLPVGYEAVQRSAGGDLADINRGSAGHSVFLAFRRHSPTVTTSA
eukprot:gnl/Spiro4/14118_TR7582_c0_g1_i1.p1 gnl/Spiro4/14118_TR7582_c0_g1~~gnl/Spiro4/14118_TR7582_c0_g1_i1.p1  ORF type:complete len:259 (+),score=30.14 gnl/Spiro4/14118_TR7582_c0_g1_i1:623-1399(+)